MNISPNNISGECNLKCTYSFNYPASNCTASNKKTYISLTYDTGAVPAVQFNEAGYNVSQILLVAPSIHQFNGVTVGAELIINHTPLAGGKSLKVCIPIVSGSSSTKATSILETIISTVSKQAPAAGDSTNIVINDFTLNSIVPTTPFYSYTDAQNVSFIVYGLRNAIDISESSLKSLVTMINVGKSITFPSGPLLFINPNGPSQKTGNGEIYIDCQPTGNSEEITDVFNVKPTVKMDFTFEAIMKNPIILFILSGILTIIIMFVLYFIITYISTGETSINFSKHKKT
uniref:Alpha-carbonic anhydrase domain-containing protein n=1 Tax=viral metagenome TaxID=1070528 RepID=A0A6C0LGJ2_9ZZZZ